MHGGSLVQNNRLAKAAQCAHCPTKRKREKLKSPFVYRILPILVVQQPPID